MNPSRESWVDPIERYIMAEFSIVKLYYYYNYNCYSISFYWYLIFKNIILFNDTSFNKMVF